MPDPRPILYSTGTNLDGIAVDVLPVTEANPTAALVVYEDDGRDLSGHYLTENADMEYLFYELPTDLWKLAPFMQATLDAGGFTGTVVCDASRDALFAETRDVILADLRDHPPGVVPLEVRAGGLTAVVLRFLAQRSTGALASDLIDQADRNHVEHRPDAEALAISRLEVERLAGVVVQHEQTAPSVAEAAIDLFLDYRGLGKDIPEARRLAIEEIRRGVAAADEISRHQAEDAAPTLLGRLADDGRIPTGPVTAGQLVAAANCYAEAGVILARTPSWLDELGTRLAAYKQHGKTRLAETTNAMLSEIPGDPLGFHYGRKPDGSANSPAFTPWPWADFPWHPADHAVDNLATAATLLNAAIVAAVAEVPAKT